MINPVCLSHKPDVCANAVPKIFSAGLDAASFDQAGTNTSFRFDTPIFKYFKACWNSRLFVEKREALQAFLCDKIGNTPLQKSRLLAMQYLGDLLEEVESELEAVDEEGVVGSCSPPYFMEVGRGDFRLMTDIMLYSTEQLSRTLAEEDFNTLVRFKAGRTLLAIIVSLYTPLGYTHFIDEHEHGVLFGINSKLKEAWEKWGYAGKAPRLHTLDELVRYARKGHDASCRPDLVAELINHALHEHFADEFEHTFEDDQILMEALSKFGGLHSFVKERTAFRKFFTKLHHFSKNWVRTREGRSNSIHYLVRRFTTEVHFMSETERDALSGCAIFRHAANDPAAILRFHAALSKVVKSAEVMAERGLETGMLGYYAFNYESLPLILGAYDGFVLSALESYSWETGERVEVEFDTSEPDFSLRKLTNFVKDLYAF